MRQSPNRQPNGLQRFGDDDGVMPDTSSSVMSEDPVIPNYGFDGISDSDVHKILHGDGEKEIVMNEDESKDAVTVDQQQTARLRNRIAANQGVFGLRDKVVISFLNAIDVEAGDWIGIVPEKVGTSGLNDDGFVDGDAYITYRYVCDPDADPLYCPHTGSVEWDVQSIGAYFPPGKYVAYLCKEDGEDDPGPYVVKAGPAYFEISAIIEAPPTNPPPTNRPPTNPNRVEIIEPAGELLCVALAKCIKEKLSFREDLRSHIQLLSFSFARGRQKKLLRRHRPNLLLPTHRRPTHLPPILLLPTHRRPILLLPTHRRPILLLRFLLLPFHRPQQVCSDL